MLILAQEWWTVQHAGWVGAGIGVLGGLFGTVLGCCGFLVQRGQAKGFVLGGFALMTVTGLAALVAVAVAFLTSQPWHVLHPLLLWGVLGTTLGLVLGLNVRKQYQQAEERKLDAAALRRGG